MPPQTAVIVQIRGPGIIGPVVQIRGPQALDPDVLQSFAEASAMGQPVSVLMAQSWADVSGLTARWPASGGAGWLVRRAITADELSAAVAEAGSELRILVAEEVADITALTANWAFH